MLIRAIPTVVRLYRAEEIPEAVRKTWRHVGEAQRAIARLREFRVDGKLRPRVYYRGSPALQKHQLPGEVVESDSGVLNGFSEHDRAAERKWLRDAVNDEDAVRLRVVFEPWHVWATVEIGSAKVVKLDQVLIGAVHPLNNASQRREGHYRGTYGAEPAGRAYAADTGGVRDTRPEESGRVPGLGEGRQAPETSSMASPPEEAGIGTSPRVDRGGSSATRIRSGSPEDA